MKQNYTADIVAVLFHQYFSDEIISYTLCDGGVENSNFLIETASGKYILKVFESSRHDEEVIRSEVQIMIEARKMGSCVPAILLTKKDENIIVWPEGKLTIMMEYIDWERYSDVLPSPELYTLIGRRVAQLQRNLLDISEKYFAPDTHIFDITYLFVHPELQKCIPDYTDAPFLQSIWADFDEIRDTFLNLPRQVIHNDINSANVIFRNREPYFIDFSDMVCGTCIQDIAIALVQRCFHHRWNPDWMHQFLTWFESIRKLSDDEKNCLFACMEARMLNILMIPYLDAGIGEYGEIQDYILAYYDSLKKFHEFGKENFMKLIP